MTLFLHSMLQNDSPPICDGMTYFFIDISGYSPLVCAPKDIHEASNGSRHRFKSIGNCYDDIWS
jgi:hypothetical protein